MTVVDVVGEIPSWCRCGAQAAFAVLELRGNIQPEPPKGACGKGDVWTMERGRGGHRDIGAPCLLHSK